MPGIDYSQLRRQITMRAVLDLVGFRATWRRGSQLRGPCPILGCRCTSGQSFSVHLARQIYHCFACRSHGNALDLWAAVRGLTLHHASLDLCHFLGLDPPWLPATRFTSPSCQPRHVALGTPLRNR
jgi:DNA primase